MTGLPVGVVSNLIWSIDAKGQPYAHVCDRCYRYAAEHRAKEGLIGQHRRHYHVCRFCFEELQA